VTGSAVSSRHVLRDAITQDNHRPILLRTRTATEKKNPATSAKIIGSTTKGPTRISGKLSNSNTAHGWIIGI